MLVYGQIPIKTELVEVEVVFALCTISAEASVT